MSSLCEDCDHKPIRDQKLKVPHGTFHPCQQCREDDSIFCSSNFKQSIPRPDRNLAEAIEYQNQMMANVVKLISAHLLAQDGCGDVDTSNCDHCLTVAVNSELAMCCICRKQIPGPRDVGICISAPATSATILCAKESAGG